MKFTNRVFGCAVVKSINSNYNADFTHQPRTLPDGRVYATDKAFKYTIRHFLDSFTDENVFYFKRFNENLNPLDLDEMYAHHFGDKPDKKSQTAKKDALRNLLSCIDVRMFGATYAGNVNVSIHGPVQIGHGVNQFDEGLIYSEQIMSPFRSDKKGEDAKEKDSSTLGTQSKLREGHYVHHFSVNPKNLEPRYELLGDDSPVLSQNDMGHLKEAMTKGATSYDSASKAGTENELLLWVQLKEGSKRILPGFTDLVNVSRENGKAAIDLGKVSEVIDSVSDDVELIEIYYNNTTTTLSNEPKDAQHYPLS